MNFEQLNTSGWAKTYLVVDADSQKAALIDPVYDFVDIYLEALNKRGLELEYAIATHTHADHITACYSLREQTGCEYAMWKDTASLKVSHYLDDGEILMLGSTPLKIHYAPGHTNDHVLIESPTCLFTGDFLFTGQGGVGRDDLPSGRVKSHWESLKILDSLDGGLDVCTGHDAPDTAMQNLEWNRNNNPVLGMTSFDEFEAWQSKITASLGSVSKIKTALPANLFAEIPESIPWME